MKTATEIRSALARRFANVRRSRAGVWFASDPTKPTVRARAEGGAQ